MKNKLKQQKELIPITIFTGILYYCGYLSSEFRSLVLGIHINYDVIDIIKWGADFIIFSFIDVFKFCQYEKEFSCISFLLIVQLLFIIFLTFNKKSNNVLLIIIALSLTLFGVLIELDHILFDGNSSVSVSLLNDSPEQDAFISKIDTIPFLYNQFTISCILFIWIAIVLYKRHIKYFYLILLPILLLPPLYGVYGRSYEFNMVNYEENNKQSILIGKEGDKRIVLIKIYQCESGESIEKGECTDVDFFYYKEADSGKILFDKVNYFKFLKP